MQTTSRKCEQFTDSVIRRMTRIAIDCNAINLAQGFPDFDPPKALTDRLQEISRMGPHQYPITMGAPNFRAAIRKMHERGVPLLIYGECDGLEDLFGVRRLKEPKPLRLAPMPPLSCSWYSILWP